MVERKGDLLLNEHSIYRCLVIFTFLPITKEEKLITECQRKCYFSRQSVCSSIDLRARNWNKALRTLKGWGRKPRAKQ